MKSNYPTKRVIKFFISVIKERKGQFFILLCCRILTSTIVMIIPRYYGELVQSMTQATTIDPLVIKALWSILLAIGGWYMIEFFAWRIFEYVIVHMETGAMKELYQKCFNYLHQHSYRFFSNNFTGALVKKVNKLVRGYESVVDITFFNIVNVIIGMILIIYIGLKQHRFLGLIFVIWIIVYGVLQYFMYKKVMPHELKSQEQDSKVTAVLADTITNHYNITTFASLPHEDKRFDQTTQDRKTLTRRSWKKKNVIYATNSLLMILGELFFFGVIIHLWSSGVIQLGMVVALQIYILQMFERIFFIGKAFKSLFSAITESAEMIEILDTPHEIQDKADAIDLSVSMGAISFEKLGFQYHQGNDILENFTLHIKAGEKIALVGPSGSGKTTIIALLLRFFDLQAGRIMIDGQDITQVTQNSVRNAIAVVPQDPILFHRSLRENIAYGKPNASDEEIITVARMAKCHDFITSFPHGYDTLVGERGMKLSGGERQRVAIARAMLEDKKILVMDEATSSLDSQSEKLIQEAIHEVIQEKTAIIIAHRLSTIKEMDRIIVMDQGKIKEQGTHHELLSRNNGLYQNLRTIQAQS